MSQPNNPKIVVIDANVLIALCTQEQDKFLKADAVLQDYSARGYLFYAPSVIVSESLYVICNKLQNGVITISDYSNAIQNLKDQMMVITLLPEGDATLIQRATEIQIGYGCSHSSDSLYLALAEELGKIQPTEIVTYDKDLVKQAAKNAPTVKVNLLTI